MSTLRRDLLGIYLNDHLAIAAGALALARRTQSAHQGSEHADEFRELERLVHTDHEALLEVLRRVGVRRTRYKESFTVVGEKLGRLKLNGALRERSPLSSLVELDGLTAAVTATQLCWRSLRELAADERALDGAHLDEALARADEELARLDALRPALTRSALHPDG